MTDNPKRTVSIKCINHERMALEFGTTAPRRTPKLPQWLKGFERTIKKVHSKKGCK